MNRISFFAGAFATALLGGCGTTAPSGADAKTMTFAQQVAAYDARAKSDLQSFGAASLVAGKAACGYISMGSGLYQAVKPGLIVAGAISPEAAGIEAAATISAQVACSIIDNANPSAPATPQVAAAVSQAVATVPAVKSLLEQDPVVAAAATAPAAPPS
jgi:hypothetical protein